MCHLKSFISFITTSVARLRSGLFKLVAVLAIASSGSFASADTATAAFSEAFGGTTISEDGSTFTFPTGAEGWGGFANMNEDLYPLRFTDAGSITFNAAVADGGSADVRFRLEFNPHPDVDPSYDAAAVTVSGATSTSYTVAIPSQGANTFSSLIMYIAENDVAVTITDVVVDGEIAVELAPADTVNVTFQVDMSAVETHEEGVYLAGGGVFGQAGVLMTDNGSDVWTTTVELDVNSTVLYKFRNQPSFDTWDGFEDQGGLIAGACVAGEYNDRYVDVAEADIVLPVVAYGSCSAEPYNPDPATTLSVGDAIDLSDAAIESFGGVTGSIVDGVLVAEKAVDAQDWGGNVINRGGVIFPLTSTDTLVTVEVNSTVPAVIRMKLESAANGSLSAEVDSTVAHTGSGWETLSFNFVDTGAIDANFDTLVLFPNFGVVGAGNTYEYRNITFTGGTPVVLASNEASFTEAFGGTTIGDGGVYTFPTGAEAWGGFANMNADIYPLRFTSDGSISFMGSVADGGSANVRFRLEYNPHPDVNPAYDAVGVTVSGATPTEYTVNVPSQGENTFSSLIMYIAENDVAVTVTDILVDGEIAVSDVVGPQTVTVTFQVDMTAVETHEEGVYLAGGGVGQDGVLMTDNGNDVWTATYDVAVNTQLLYKFRNQPSFGTWDGFEDANTLVAGGCNTGEYNDRFVDVAEADIVLPVVAYGSCTAEPYVSDSPAVSFTVAAADATTVSFHSSGLGWNLDSALVAVSNGDGTWTATKDPGFPAGVEYKWIIDGVEEDLSTAYRNGECADDNVAAYEDTWFNRTWAADSGDVTGDVAGVCSGSGPSGSWDFDQDGNADALTDGLLLLRYAFGLTGDALVASAIAEASPLTPEQVQDNVHASTTSFADIDANGTVDALTDGLLLLRYLFGLTGDALLASAVAEDATRTSADDIEAYILSLYP